MTSAVAVNGCDVCSCTHLQHGFKVRWASAGIWGVLVNADMCRAYEAS
jgi:hypothetical protein